MRPLPALIALGAAACDTDTKTERQIRDNNVPPTAEELAACEDEGFGDSDFDWTCCDVWYRQCVADGRDIEDDCGWICNG